MIRCSLWVCTFVLLVLGFATRAQAIVITFQEGVAGYGSTQDTYIRQADVTNGTPLLTYGAATVVVADTEDTNIGGVPQLTQGLIRFDNLFGGGPGQIPVGSTINSATLRFNTENPSNNTMALHEMLQTWTEAATYAANFGGNGIQTNGVEAKLLAVDTDTPAANGFIIYDVTASLQNWVTNPAQNFGWAVIPGGTDGWQFTSSEGATTANRPFLDINYTLAAVPEPSSIALFTVLGFVGVAAAWCSRRKGAAR